MSCSMLMLIALDRYACMRYLTRYQIIMNKTKINLLAGAMFVFSFFNTLIICIGTHLDMFGMMTGLSGALTLILFIPMLGLYIKSHHMVQRQVSFMKTLNASNTSFMRNFDRSLTKLVRIEVVTSVSLYSIFIVFSVANSGLAEVYKRLSFVDQGWVEFSISLGLIISLLICVNNAIIFLSMNKKSNQFWKNALQQKLNLFVSSPSSSALAQSSGVNRTNMTESVETTSQKSNTAV